MCEKMVCCVCARFVSAAVCLVCVCVISLSRFWVLSGSSSSKCAQTRFVGPSGSMPQISDGWLVPRRLVCGAVVCCARFFFCGLTCWVGVGGGCVGVGVCGC